MDNVFVENDVISWLVVRIVAWLVARPEVKKQEKNEEGGVNYV